MKSDATLRAIEIAQAKTEKAIQKMLLDFANDCEVAIDEVRVDTRNFANLGVEIFLKPEKQ